MDRLRRKMAQPANNLVYICFLLFTLVCAYVSVWLSVAGVSIVILVFFLSKRMEKRRRREIVRYMQNVSMTADDTLRASLTRFPMPALVAVANTGKIIWSNNAFEEATGHYDCALSETIKDLNADFDTRWLAEGKPNYPGELSIGENLFWVYGNLLSGDHIKEEMLMVLYFVPCTDYIQAKQAYEQSRPIVSIVSIDNYEELMKECSDSEKSTLLAEIDKRLSRWTKESRCILRKYDRDKYIFVLETTDFNRLMHGKFSVMEEVRNIENRGGVAATLSIGIGKDSDSFEEGYRFAGIALDMALSRGGDQAVIKTRYNFEFFGGLSKELEKRTKVKSRVVANALVQMIRDSSQVMIMGHKLSDMDSIGSAVGMACAVRHRDRPVYIVVDKERSLASDLIRRIEELPEYEGVFLHPDDAMVKCDFNTLLIVVDTNRPDYVESQSLLESINKIAVIDHHRRAASYIQNFALNLHEPYASSAAELVSEMLQYMIPTSGISKVEAESILAGLYLDTKGFSVKTGVRTFEAAAYLKRAGADITEVKKLFLNTFEGYMTCQRIVANARDVGNGVILAVTSEDVGRIEAAQAADNLLSIIGVDASMVAYKTGENIMVSARSFGKINVQMLMEYVGGGGNHSSAGAQLMHTSLDEAEKMLLGALERYQQEHSAADKN